MGLARANMHILLQHYITSGYNKPLNDSGVLRISPEEFFGILLRHLS